MGDLGGLPWLFFARFLGGFFLSVVCVFSFYVVIDTPT